MAKTTRSRPKTMADAVRELEPVSSKPRLRGSVRAPASAPLSETDPVVCYVLVRTDCPDWNVGKFFAQVHHNGCDLVESIYEKNDASLNELYREWKEDRNFGIALSLATTAAQCRQAISLATVFGVHAMMTNDPTYPIRNGDSFVTASVDTVGFIFGRKSEVGMLVSQFELFSPKHVPNA